MSWPYVGSCVLVFAMGAAYQWLQPVRRYCEWRDRRS